MLYFDKRRSITSGLIAVIAMGLFCCSYDENATCKNVLGDINELYSEIDSHAYREKLKDDILDRRINLTSLNNPFSADTSIIDYEIETEIKEEIRLGEIELLAQLCEAEAGNQGLKGKQLVCDVVLNRVESSDPLFPDSVEEVIFQKGQFACIDSGLFDKAGWYISDESFKAALTEYENQNLDSKILYFTAGGYNRYCTPAYKYKDHYFGY